MTTSRRSRPTSPRPSSRPLPPYGLRLQAAEADEAATTDKHGGRVERRRLRVTTMLAGYLDWPGLAQVGRLERTVTVGGEVTVEVQYLISSVPR
jgi:hypothetical protein